MTPAMRDHIEHCWRRGDSIAEARLSALRNCGTKPDFETVRRCFAHLSRQIAEVA